MRELIRRAEQQETGGGSGPASARAPAATRPMRLGAVDDPAEREADRVAESLLRPTTPTATPAPIAEARAPIAQRMCASCAAHDDDEVRRKPAAGARGGGDVAGPTATRIDAARGRGAPLPADLRAHVEPRLGFDFSAVRIHAEPADAAVARDLDARAFTVGTDIFFAADQYRPLSAEGQRLIAHELVHVVQQGGGSHPAPGEPAAGVEARDPAIRRWACQSVLDATEEQVVAESSVRDALLPLVPSPRAREFPIPDASFAPYRDPPSDPGAPGRADLAHLRGTTMEIVELKRGDWSEMAYVQDQLRNYVDHANDPLTDNLSEISGTWRARGVPTAGVTEVRPMPVARFSPGSPIRVGGTPTTVSWCDDGVIVFKAIGDQDPDILSCGPLAPEVIDRYVDRAFGYGQTLIDSEIDEVIGPQLDAGLATMGLREALLLLLASPAARRAIEEMFGPEAAMVWSALPAELVATMIAEAIGEEGDRLLRDAVRYLRDYILGTLRIRMRTLLRDLIVEELNALCATAGAVIMSELLDQLRRSLRQRMLEELPVAVAEGLVVAAALAVAAVAAVMIAVLLAAAAAALIVFLLPEILAAVGALLAALTVAVGEAWAAIAAFMAAGGGVVLQRAMQGG